MDAATTHGIHPGHFLKLSLKDQALARELLLLCKCLGVTPHSTLHMLPLEEEECYVLQREENLYGEKDSKKMELKPFSFVGFIEEPDFKGDSMEKPKRAHTWGRLHNEPGDLTLIQLQHAQGMKHIADYSQPKHSIRVGTDASVKFKETPAHAVVCAPEFAHLTNKERQLRWNERFDRLLIVVDAFEKIISSAESDEFCDNAPCLRLPCKNEPSSVCCACEYKKVVAHFQRECDKLFRSVDSDRVFFSNATVSTEKNKRRKMCD